MFFLIAKHVFSSLQNVYDSVLLAITTGNVEDLKEFLDDGYLDEDLLETKSVSLLSFSENWISKKFSLTFSIAC